MTDKPARFVVDRREGAMLAIEDADGVFRDVPVADLPAECRAEGAVIDVPVVAGRPDWGRAERNRAEERRRVMELTKRMNRLRKKDPGGDVEL